MILNNDYLLIFIAGLLLGVGIVSTGYGIYNALWAVRYRLRRRTKEA